MTRPAIQSFFVLLTAALFLFTSAGKSLAVNFTSLPPNPPLIPAPLPSEILYEHTFDVGSSCTAAGWTTVDVTAQANYFHVDNYFLVSIDFGPIAGAKSLWCGARPNHCNYPTFTGYGNNWDQAWCTKVCIPVTGNLEVKFDARFDSESCYDFTTLEYTLDCSGTCGWTVLDGGACTWDGLIPLITIDSSYPLLGSPVKLRLHFQSDSDWSDEDGFYPSSGAAHFDNLQVEGLALEDFEGEAVGATSSNDWVACSTGFGDYMALFQGSSVLQQDPVTKDLTCVWAAIQGSTATYACGGFPAFTAVPYGNCQGQHLNNEIWSPDIPLGGFGAKVMLQFSVYRDLPLDNMVFYDWHVRTTVSGCAGPWRDHDFVYYGGGKDWFIHQESVGDLVDLANGTSVKIALGAIDMCGVWCGIYGSGACHSQAPLFDHVLLWRTTNSPQWAVHDIDQFQDNFATDGSVTGTVRADMAKDIRPGTSPTILPGDSAVVTVAETEFGIANDLVNGGKKIYLYAAVWPLGQPGKSGAALTQNPSRFPYVGSQVIGGTTWFCIRLDPCILNGDPVPDRFCVDLNDNLFTPGDTICFFYCAENTNGVRSYSYGTDLGTTSNDLNDAAANPSEFTCLPAGGWSGGGDVLYVNGMAGRTARPPLDAAFQNLLILNKVDRYDVRGPSSAVSNSLASRVINVQTQLLDCYRKIIWDCGDMEVTLGDASGPLYKANDYGLVNTFLSDLTLPGGVYLCGDDVALQLNGLSGASAVTFKSTFLTYTLTTGNHAPNFGTSPVGRGTANNCFAGDHFFIYGGAPLLNAFDVMTPTGASVMEMSYGTTAATNGAVISKRTTNSNNVSVGVLLSGFSFIYIADDDNDGISDAADHMHDILTWLGNTPPQPTGSGPVAKNELLQNYPNPFNPQTTIGFSVKKRGIVSLKIYNVAGQLVRVLADEEFAVGAHTKVWDGRDSAGQAVSSGVYFYKLVAGDFQQTKKMVMLK